MKKILSSILIVTLLTLGVVQVFGTAQVYGATPKEAACEGLDITGGSCTYDPTQPGINSTIQLVINIMSVLVGFAAVLMIIIGGFKYITSSGDSAGVNSAKNTILFAVVGLVIVAVAQIIVRFVINEATTPLEETTMQMVQKANV